ncbi:subtilisin-like protein [Lactarius psammicola]|nr:subtilisin-like protein [Lactarius psammicola]
MRYHPLSLFFILATLPLAGLTTSPAPHSHWDDMRLKHAWNTIPAGWESLGPPPSGTTIDLHVALKPHNKNALVDALYQVSSPGHPRQVLYNTPPHDEEVAKLVTPHTDTLELVHSWLEHHGVPSSSISTSHGGGWLTLTGIPVSQANEMLGASYQLHQLAGTNDGTVLRTVGYALPAVLHPHVQTIVPTTYFGPMHTLPQTPHPPVGAAAEPESVGSREPVTGLWSRKKKKPEPIVPSDLRWLYKTSGYVPAAMDKNMLGIAGYSGEYPSQKDLTLFMTVYLKEAMAATFTVEKVNGGEYYPNRPGFEANLDVQYAQAIAFPTPLVFYSTGGVMTWTPPSNEPAQNDAVLAWLKYMLAKTKIPQTITTSNGIEEKKLPREYATALCDLFAQLGARGVSILFASGDSGVGAGDCKDDDGNVQFIPQFPASCPYVTSVGGTTGYEETAADLSGGGFSNYFSRPDYQDELLPKYFRRLGRRYKGLYNASGRGIPDIAAQALHYEITLNSGPRHVSGTSCAAPLTTNVQTVAGIISLLNDFLISEGKKPLGFLNPWLYGVGRVGLNDIKTGSNPGCGTKGFFAVTGWDPVTGLGTPDFFELQHTGGHLYMKGKPAI